jgi:hypothetical protein
MFNRWMLIPLGLIGLFVLLMMFEIPMNAMHNISTDQKTDAGLACTSDPDDVVLTTDLWQADINSVISGVDDQGNILTATNYVAATRTLTVTGWVTPATTCTIVYEYDALTEWTGFGPMVAISPMLIYIAMIGGCIWMVVAGALSLRGGP